MYDNFHFLMGRTFNEDFFAIKTELHSLLNIAVSCFCESRCHNDLNKKLLIVFLLSKINLRLLNLFHSTAQHLS